MGVNHLADLTSEEFKATLKANTPKLSENIKEQQAPEFSQRLGQQSGIDLRPYLQQRVISSSQGCNDNYAWIGAVNHNPNYYISRGIPVQYLFSP